MKICYLIVLNVRMDNVIPVLLVLVSVLTETHASFVLIFILNVSNVNLVSATNAPLGSESVLVENPALHVPP